MLADEGKANAIKFVEELKGEGIKPGLSGDLWSNNGAALFGMCAHGITVTKNATPKKWTMRNILVGAVPCRDERHTAVMITTTTKEALKQVAIEMSSVRG